MKTTVVVRPFSRAVYRLIGCPRAMGPRRTVGLDCGKVGCGWVLLAGIGSMLAMGEVLVHERLVAKVTVVALVMQKVLWATSPVVVLRAGRKLAKADCIGGLVEDVSVFALI